MSSKAGAAPPLNPASLDPDSFMASQPPRPEDLPSQAAFDASHRAAVAEQFGEPMLKAGPAPSWVERLKESILGGPYAGNTAVGRAIGRDYRATSEMAKPEGELPLVQPAALMPQQPTSVAGGAAKGALQFASGLTTAPNLLLAAGSGGIGMLGKISGLLPRAVSAVFTVQMLKNAYDSIPAIKDRWDHNDMPGVAQEITKAVLSGALGVAAGAHAVRGGGAAVLPPEATEAAEPSTEAAQPSPVQRATASARAGVEALTPDGFMESEQPSAVAKPAEETAQAVVGGPDEFMASPAAQPVGGASDRS